MCLAHSKCLRARAANAAVSVGLWGAERILSRNFTGAKKTNLLNRYFLSLYCVQRVGREEQGRSLSAKVLQGPQSDQTHTVKLEPVPHTDSRCLLKEVMIRLAVFIYSRIQR